LSSISSMGFRGEALPSIASVSRFTLTTRECDDQSGEGTQIVISGGKILEVKASGSAPGTSVEVRQLFFNLPARRKFLRSEETETAHIQHYLTLAALAYPEVALAFIREQRTVWQLPPVTNPDRLSALRERMRALSGAEEHLISVGFSVELPAMGAEEDGGEASGPGDRVLHLWGVIGAPGVSRSTRDDQHLFVNRRPVENRGLNFALLEGYHTALMKGRYPVCCLFLELNPDEVDVNIHPAKKEIKFHQERTVRTLVTRAIREALLQFHGKAQGSSSSSTAEVTPPPSTVARQLSPAPPAPTPHTPELRMPPAQSRRSFEAPVQTRKENVAANRDAVEPATPATRTVEAATAPDRPDPDPLQRPYVAPAAGPVPLLNVPLRLVGVVGRLYVVLESDRGLVLLDQHAAHERILFEQMLRRLEQNGQAPSQRLLLPETVELSVRDAQFLREQLTTLARLGVGLSEFGDRTFLLDALPPFVKTSEPRRFVLELVDEMKATGQAVNTLRLGEHVIAKTVCRHAVKANDPLSGPELEKLVEDLRHCEMPYTCPHGRPTLIEMNFRELEKKFGRQV
jgi:DNA mismatch repair protein MutL